ncbi:MAG: hypothetical protein GY898_17485 [Proteobacteria bacterium]|nr:hypothetical protein [Pseudomonadota bacterium]
MKRRLQALLRDLRPWRWVLLVGLIVSILVTARVMAGMQPYGVEGAHYIEHAERMTVLGAPHRAGGPDGGSLADELDGAFPPLLHLITIGLGLFTGQAAERVALTGLLWLWGLAAALGATAWLFTRSRFAAGAAACGGLLLPAAHGFATRYYYDLPMTALLWAMVPVALATWDRKPIAGGLGVGAIWLAADLIKWSALPFGAFLLLAVAVTPGRTPNGARTFRIGARVGALALAGLVSIGGSLAWIALAGAESSLGVMLDVMWAGLGSSSVGSGSVGGLFDGLRTWVAERGLLLGSRFSADKLVYYGVQGVTTVVSPLLTLPLVVLAVLGAFKHRAAVVLAVVSILGQLIFLVLWIPVIDERFLLTSVPALIVLAALGLEEAPRRVPVAIAVAVLGLWVAVEFHTGLPILPATNWEAAPGATWEAPPLRGWGLAAGDSEEQRGWSRAATTQDNHDAARKELWAIVEEARPQLVLIPNAAMEASPAGELYWLDYRSMLAGMRDQELMFELDVDCGMIDEADLVIVSAGVEGACYPQGWQERGTVTPPGDGAPEIRVLVRP